MPGAQNQWFFKDPQGQVQGPFDDGMMRAWLEAGYLAADLPICNGSPRNQFRKLSDWFPNAIVAFLPPDQAKQMGGGTEQPQKEGEWYFVDKNQKVQGPFGDFHMRQWHLAGYFEPTLMIMNRAIPNSQWKMLKELFPHIADAFLVSVGSNNTGAPAPSTTKPQPTDIKTRFEFPEWLPVPPRFRGVKKTYPSESKGNARRQVNITDVHGQNVKTFAHAQ